MHSRRNFIKQASLAAAGILIIPNIANSKPTNKVGIQLYTLRDQLPHDVKGVMAKVAAAGYKEVETYDYSLKHKFWGLTPKEFAGVLKDNGLSAPSGHYGMDKYLSGGSDDELKAYIEAAKGIGSQYLVVPYLGEEIRMNLDAYKAIAGRLNKAAEICHRSGLQLAYHNHDFEFQPMAGSSGYQTLLKETDAGLVKFEMDLYWVVRSGHDPITLFKQHPGRFALWHVKDMDKLKPHINTEVGSGSIDFKAIFKNRNLSGMKHFYMEQENFSKDPFVSIKQSCDHIKKNLI